MKLKPHGITYNGQRLAADEFAFIQVGHALEPTEIVLPCSGGKYANCILRITRGEAKVPVWHWDGNREAPTLSPSIGCDHRCGWHGHLIAGELKT